MKGLKMLKWYWENSYMGLVAMYGVMLGVLVLMMTIIGIADTSTEVHFQSFDVSATIMLFVMMLLFFSQGTRFAVGNGVSRKTIYLSAVGYAVGMSVLLNIINTICEKILSLTPIQGESIVTLIYPSGSWLGNFVGRCATSLFFAFLGFFIGGAYYRMNKLQRWIVSILVPSVLVFGIPVFINYAPKTMVAKVASGLGELVVFAARSGYHLALVLTIVAVIFGGASWLFLRKAPLKTV